MIFLGLIKGCDALDRSRCLGILEGYGVSPGARRLLHNYWRRLTMAARAGEYYGTAFKGARGVPDDRVHYHIEYCGGQRVALRHPPRAFESRPVVPSCSSRHG